MTADTGHTVGLGASMESQGVGLDFPGREALLANRAVKGDSPIKAAPLQHRLGSDSIETALAEVMHRFRPLWISFGTDFYAALQPINKDSFREFDQGISNALIGGLFEFTGLLLTVGELLLKSQQLEVVREESALGLEQLVVELGNDWRDLVEISDAKRGRSQVLGERNGTDGGGDS